MKTCKNCIHYDACGYHIDEETKMTVNECSVGFKDKARFVELGSDAMIAQTPCDVCAYYPPSSGDGKSCSMCPAKTRQ